MKPLDPRLTMPQQRRVLREEEQKIVDKRKLEVLARETVQDRVLRKWTNRMEP